MVSRTKVQAMPKPRMHAEPDPDIKFPDSARDLAKQELARRLSKLALDNDWNQADVHRASGISKEQISSYFRGKSFPTPRGLRALANAFGIKPDELVPEAQAMVSERDIPAFEIKQIPGSNVVWVRMHRRTSMDTALKIAALLHKDAGE